MRCNVRRYLGPFVVGENIYYIFLIQEGERHYSEAWYYSLLDQNKWHTIYFIHSDDFITFYPELFSLPRKLRGGHKHWDGKSTLQMRREKNVFFLKGLYLSSFTFHTVNLDTKKAFAFFCFLDGSESDWACLLGDCPLRAESRANLSPEISLEPVTDEESSLEMTLVMTNIGCHESSN